MAGKFYAVRKGKSTGIFFTWDECKKQVDGYSGAEYKSFKTLEEAGAYLGLQTGSSKASETKNADVPGDVAKPDSSEDTGWVEAYVDGSYYHPTKEYSFGVVILKDGQECTYFEKDNDEELATMRNVAGEIKGAQYAMQYALDNGIAKLRIYHDYEGIAKWCTGAWKTNKEGTKAYRAFYESIADKVQVEFVKVAGHTGVKYNEMADHLAKEALGLLE